MAEEKKYIQYVETTDGVLHPIDASFLNGVASKDYQVVSNLVNEINESSTDDKYPSAKCVYDIVGDLNIK